MRKFPRALVHKPNRNSRRKEIYDKFKGQCCYCGIGLLFEEMTLDHVVPRSRNGGTHGRNLIPSCLRCNNRKGSKPVLAWYQAQPKYCPERLARIIKVCGWRSLYTDLERWRGLAAEPMRRAG